jgi:hypothetical protein
MVPLPTSLRSVCSWPLSSRTNFAAAALSSRDAPAVTGPELVIVSTTRNALSVAASACRKAPLVWPERAPACRGQAEDLGSGRSPRSSA